MADKSTIYIPLPKENLSFLSPNEKRFSGYVSSVCGPLDKLLTPIRYVAVSESILYDKGGIGSAIEFMNSGSVISWILKGLTLGVAGIIVAFNLYLEHQEQKKEKEKKEKELQQFRASLERQGLQQIENKYTADQERRRYVANLEKFNEFLREALKENKDLQEKYEFLELDYKKHSEDLELIKNNIKLKVVGKKRDVNKLEKFQDKVDRNLKPFYDIGNLVSFVYWVLWISVGIVTGVHSPFGIFGLPTWLTFLGPLAVVALPFMGIRVWNYMKHRLSGDGQTWEERNNDAKLKHQAENDFQQIMNEANKKAEFAFWKQQNQALALELDDKAYAEKKSQKIALDSLGENSVFNGAAFNATVHGLVNSASSQVNFQYIAWFATDALIAGLGITMGVAALTPVGWGLLGLSVLFGAVAAGHRYLESQKLKNQAKANRDSCGTENTIDIPAFEKMVEEKQTKLLELKKELYADKLRGYAIPDTLNLTFEELYPEEKNASFWDRLSSIRNNPWIDALDWQMTGIFVGRIVVPVSSVAIFWACTSIAVVAALSNPVALGVVFAIGAIYTLSKWYDKKQKKLEEHLTNLPKENAKLDQEIALVELALDTNKKLAAKNSKDGVMILPTSERESVSKPLFSPKQASSKKKTSFWNFFGCGKEEVASGESLSYRVLV